MLLPSVIALSLFLRPLSSEISGTGQLESDTKHIKHWIKENITPHYGDIADLDNFEKAKIINYAVYNSCILSSHNLAPSEINQLFYDCKTQCGGYSYVMEHVLSFYGVNNRRVNIYNVPQVGNHTAVEVEVADGIWSFFDPTYGTYFVSEGQPYPASLSDIGQSFDVEDLKNGARQALLNRTGFAKYEYKNEFTDEYMNVENYISFEQIEFVGETVARPLVIPIDLASGSFQTRILENDSTEQEFVDNWLAYTYETLNDDDPLNNTSFVAGFLTYDRKDISIVRIDNMQPNTEYRFRFQYFTSNEMTLSIVPVGIESNVNPSGIVQMGQGQGVTEMTVSSDTTRAQIMMNRGNGEVGYLRIGSISITPN